MTFKQGIPSHDACSDLFNALAPLKPQTVLRRLVEGFAEQSGDVIAVDGKTPRCSCDRARQQSAKGQMVTADAMHTQKANARAVTQAGGDDVLALKGNQGTLYEGVSLFLDAPGQAGMCDACQRVDGAHGRIETRRALLGHDLAWLNARHDWPGLKAIGKAIATHEKEGNTTTQSRYYLLSTSLSAERCLAVTCAHWAIENSLHWVLDVTMNEDRARNRKQKGPENLAMMRRVALNLARAEKSEGSMRGRLKKARWHEPVMLHLIHTACHVLKRLPCPANGKIRADWRSAGGGMSGLAFDAGQRGSILKSGTGAMANGTLARAPDPTLKQATSGGSDNDNHGKATAGWQA